MLMRRRLRRPLVGPVLRQSPPRIPKHRRGVVYLRDASNFWRFWGSVCSATHRNADCPMWLNTHSEQFVAPPPPNHAAEIELDLYVGHRMWPRFVRTRARLGVESDRVRPTMGDVGQN